MEEKNQLTKRTDIVLAIKKLNPGVKISLGDPSLITDNDEYKMFYCSVPGDQLKLPEDLEYNEKNGITNKHNTDGVYNISIRVEEIPQEGDIRFLPEEIEDVSQSTSLLDVTKVIQQLNPYAEIRLGSIKDPIRHRRIYSSVSPEQLILPEGFYYNSKNGITNKHRTESGIYCAFDVSDLRSVDESFLEPKESEIGNYVSKLIPDKKIISRNSPTTIKQRKKVMQIIMDAIRNLRDRIFNRGENDDKDRWDSNFKQ